MKPTASFRGIVISAAFSAIVAIFVITGWPASSTPPAARSQAAPAAPARAAAAPQSPLSGAVVFHPLPASRKSASHEWTAGDAVRPDVIEKIARNPDEFIRMVEENDRIKRRQLVYRKETVPMLLDRARDRGEALQSVVLPGLDGREIEVEVTQIDERPELGGGSLTGRVKGRFNSMVSVGFTRGYEAFNISSPDDNLFLTADAREPGEVIVKEIDPAAFAPATSGGDPDFIITQDR